jgi:DEAD/DEAH box helicase domain-containing protein
MDDASAGAAEASEASEAKPRAYAPTLFLYEHVPGGTGLSERVYEQQATLLAAAANLIARCPCQAGCPACVGPSETPLAVGQGGAPLSRRDLALRLLGGS